MSSNTKIIAALVSNAPPLISQARSAIRAGAELVELRLDLINDVNAVREYLSIPDAPPAVLTLRGEAEGGRWKGHKSERTQILRTLADLNPAYIDVELAAWEESDDLRQLVADLCLNDEDAERPTAIFSHHDYTSRSIELRNAFARLAAAPPGVVKEAFTPMNALQACRILEELRRLADQRRVIAVGMGEAGLIARVLAKKFGAWATFAATEHGVASAPGQPTIAELREAYGWDRINRNTRVYAVIGWPVAHSLSPRLHNEYMRIEGINGVYLPAPIQPAYTAFAMFMDYVVENPWLDFCGFSVTIPHKEYALRWLSERDATIGEAARRCGAVNTLIRDEDGDWRGENTDAVGLIRALTAVPEIRERGLGTFSIDVIGAGGVARAAVSALTEFGCRITIFNRTQERAEILAQEFSCEHAEWDSRDRGDSDIVINCTNVGMDPYFEASPMPVQRFASRPIVFDTIYNPAETRLLLDAREYGCTVVSGMDMFVSQAAEQIALWHYRDAGDYFASSSI